MEDIAQSLEDEDKRVFFPAVIDTTYSEDTRYMGHAQAHVSGIAFQNFKSKNKFLPHE